MGFKKKVKETVKGASIGGAVGLALTPMLPGADLFGTYIGGGLGYNSGANQSRKEDEKKASDTLITQENINKNAETAKYQAMVDATYGSQAKKRGTGRPGTGLYAGMSGGASGLYNV